jgi:hypothetical protein
MLFLSRTDHVVLPPYASEPVRRRIMVKQAIANIVSFNSHGTMCRYATAVHLR